jgi:hypothetical protein
MNGSSLFLSRVFEVPFQGDSFTFEPGLIYVVKGRGASGKTTLLSRVLYDGYLFSLWGRAFVRGPLPEGFDRMPRPRAPHAHLSGLIGKMYCFDEFCHSMQDASVGDLLGISKWSKAFRLLKCEKCDEAAPKLSLDDIVNYYSVEAPHILLGLGGDTTFLSSDGSDALQKEGYEKYFNEEGIHLLSELAEFPCSISVLLDRFLGKNVSTAKLRGAVGHRKLVSLWELDAQQWLRRGALEELHRCSGCRAFQEKRKDTPFVSPCLKDLGLLNDSPLSSFFEWNSFETKERLIDLGPLLEKVGGHWPLAALLKELPLFEARILWILSIEKDVCANDVLLVDEPFLRLSDASLLLMVEALQRVSERGACLILTSCEESDREREFFGDRVRVINLRHHSVDCGTLISPIVDERERESIKVEYSNGTVYIGTSGYLNQSPHPVHSVSLVRKNLCVEVEDLSVDMDLLFQERKNFARKSFGELIGIQTILSEVFDKSPQARTLGVSRKKIKDSVFQLLKGTYDECGALTTLQWKGVSLNELLSLAIGEVLTLLPPTLSVRSLNHSLRLLQLSHLPAKTPLFRMSKREMMKSVLLWKLEANPCNRHLVLNNIDSYFFGDDYLALRSFIHLRAQRYPVVTEIPTFPHQ